MLNVNNISLQFGKRVLFDDVNINFNQGNCYGVIGANGAGKSTFLKILTGEQDPTTGHVSLENGKRMSVLSQDHYKYDENLVIHTVIMGNDTLWGIMKEKDELYAKPDFNDADGMRTAELEEQFAEMDGWNAESDAAGLLSNLGIPEALHYENVGGLDAKMKLRVLLAQALFGDPDLLIMDEPTNDLDVQTIGWLEDFLANFKNTVIVVSHDRHFLDHVCTNIADIDRCKLQLHTGNYSFWYESSQLAMKLISDKNKKLEDKKKDLQNFIARFSENASKSKQATSRKKILDKLDIQDIKPSSRRYPGIFFKSEREVGDQILSVEGLSKSSEGEELFRDLSFEINKGDKIAFISKNSKAMTMLFKILAGEEQADSGEFKWGVTSTHSYLPTDNQEYFKKNLDLVDWLRQYSSDQDESYVRGFFGRMLFSGEETQKMVGVLSGGEKVRCMISKIMQEGTNVLMLDEPTNHLDLESIQAFNNGLKEFEGQVLFTSHDHEFVQTVANRIIELTPAGCIDQMMEFDEYLTSDKVKAAQGLLHQPA
jgi:ATPase subunit of ABC transporter with duplicated ATPase domains